MVPCVTFVHWIQSVHPENVHGVFSNIDNAHTKCMQAYCHMHLDGGYFTANNLQAGPTHRISNDCDGFRNARLLALLRGMMHPIRPSVHANKTKLKKCFPTMEESKAVFCKRCYKKLRCALENLACSPLQHGLGGVQTSRWSNWPLKAQVVDLLV